MKINFVLTIALVSILSSCNTKTSEKEDWQSIFNGEDLEGWTIKISGYPSGENFNNTFRVEDGAMKMSFDEYESFNGEFGHIFYHKKLSSYKLRFKYRFTGEQVAEGPGWAYRNSGAMLHCQSPESMGLDQDFPVSIEGQLLGGDGSTERSTGNLCTPGTNVIMNNELIERHCTNSISKTYHGDIWVSAEFVVYADSVIHHIIEGDTVISYNKPQIGGGSIPEDFPLPEGTLLDGGYISLQAESHPVEFKNIELLIL